MVNGRLLIGGARIGPPFPLVVQKEPWFLGANSDGQWYNTQFCIFLSCMNVWMGNSLQARRGNSAVTG